MKKEIKTRASSSRAHAKKCGECGHRASDLWVNENKGNKKKRKTPFQRRMSQLWKKGPQVS